MAIAEFQGSPFIGRMVQQVATITAAVESTFKFYRASDTKVQRPVTVSLVEIQNDSAEDLIGRYDDTALGVDTALAHFVVPANTTRTFTIHVAAIGLRVAPTGAAVQYESATKEVFVNGWAEE